MMASMSSSMRRLEKTIGGWSVKQRQTGSERDDNALVARADDLLGSVQDHVVELVLALLGCDEKARRTSVERTASGMSRERPYPWRPAELDPAG
jgi:hypothetical protein